MSIVTVVQNAIDATTSIKSSGRGLKSYANVEQDFNQFPRAWLFNTKINSNINGAGAISNSYTVEMDIADICDFGATTLTINEKLNYVITIAQLFIINLWQQADIVDVTDIEYNEVVHEFDANLVGYVIRFKCELNETITYC